MQHLNEAIKEAYEAGYKPAWIDKNVTEHWFGMSENNTFSIPATLLDPEFWKFYGKARGWAKKKHYYSHSCNTEWEFRWHCFIDHLAEGKDAESFFATLV